MVERISNLTKVNLSALGFITVMNTLSIFIDGFDWVYIATYVAPFILIIGALYLLRKWQSQITCYFLLIAGIIVILVGNNGNFSGAIFIIFSIHLDPGRNKTIFKLALMAITIAIKSLLIQITTIQLINLMFIHFLVYIYYYVLFTEKKTVTIYEIEDQTDQIIDYLMAGLTIKEIGIKTCLTPAAVTKRINRLRDSENCKTTYQLMAIMSQKRQTGKKIDKFKIV